MWVSYLLLLSIVFALFFVWFFYLWHVCLSNFYNEIQSSILLKIWIQNNITMTNCIFGSAIFPVLLYFIFFCVEILHVYLLLFLHSCSFLKKFQRFLFLMSCFTTLMKNSYFLFLLFICLDGLCYQSYQR